MLRQRLLYVWNRSELLSRLQSHFQLAYNRPTHRQTLYNRESWSKQLLTAEPDPVRQLALQNDLALTREANEHLMEAMATRMQQQPEKFKLRKTLAEHPFGTIKRWFGYTHFLLKGLAKVQCEWSLTTLAYNLKRVLNLVSFEKLMAAVA